MLKEGNRTKKETSKEAHTLAPKTDGAFLWSVKFFNEKTFTCWILAFGSGSGSGSGKKLIKFHVCIPEGEAAEPAEAAAAGQMNNVNVSREHRGMGRVVL